MAQRRFWLLKSEPTAYSFADLMSEPDQTAEWDGVRNYQARNFLRDDIKGETEVAHPVTLAQIKANPALPDISLIKRPRISVHPTTADEWRIILEMGEAGP